MQTGGVPKVLELRVFFKERSIFGWWDHTTKLLKVFTFFNLLQKQNTELKFQFESPLFLEILKRCIKF